MTAIFAFSFGDSKEHGPGKSNFALGKIIDEVSCQFPEDLVIVQAPLDKCVTTTPDHLIAFEEYINSEKVIERAIPFLKENGVQQIRLVAHPFLHRFQCARLLRRYGFEVEIVPTGWVPFDRHSDGWWTRGPLRLLAYAILTIFGLHGLGYRKPSR